jgi:hypothetical protein
VALKEYSVRPTKIDGRIFKTYINWDVDYVLLESELRYIPSEYPFVKSFRVPSYIDDEAFEKCRHIVMLAKRYYSVEPGTFVSGFEDH